MSNWKIGLHNAGVTGQRTNYDKYLAATASANQPAIVQSVDNAGVIFDVQKRNNPHDVLVFRINRLEHADFAAEPIAWSNKRYDDIVKAWPPELDPTRVYTCNLNESEHKLENIQDVEWVAAVTLQHAIRAVADGRRYCAYGWSGGAPEAWFWELDDTLSFLRLCAAHPDLLAVSLHEYSFDDDLTDNYPYLLGRFQFLLDVCDDHNIPYPQIIIGEFGLREASFNPKPHTFKEQMQWAQDLYGAYDCVLGAMLWTIGGWSGSVVSDVIGYIPDLCEMIKAYDGTVSPPPIDPPEGAPREQYKRVYWVAPAGMSDGDMARLYGVASQSLVTVGPSYDDAGIGALENKTAVLWNIPAAQQQTFTDWYALHYPGTKLQYAALDSDSVATVLPVAPVGDGAPRVQYTRKYWVVPGTISPQLRDAIYQAAAVAKVTVGPSYDDAGIGALDRKTAVLWNILDTDKQTFRDWYATHYPGTIVEFATITSQINLVYRPCDTERITQLFGANPARYTQYGLPGHDGIDYGAAAGWPYYAAAAGRVIHASDRQWSNPANASDYGWHVVIDHGTYCTVYAHAQAPLPVTLGQQVAAGAVVGKSGNTGNSDGYHLHFGLLDKSGTVDPNNGYPTWKYGRPVNPLPWLAGLQPPSTPSTPSGDALLGLHASADPGDLYGRTAEVDEFGELYRAAGGKFLVKVLNAHSVTAVSQLAERCPGADWIVRAFLNFGSRTITPQQFFNDTIGDTRRTVEVLTNRGIDPKHIYVELHNEPNLNQEGNGRSWTSGATFGNWLLEVLRLYRLALPTVRYMYPGLSPGGDEPGIRIDATRFLNDSATAVAACDALAAHCYWSAGWPMSTALAWLDAHKKFNKPSWVTEASRNDRPSVVSAGQYAAEYVQFWQECRKRPFVAGVAYFVASASNGYFAPECWIKRVDGDFRSRGIAAGMRRLLV